MVLSLSSFTMEAQLDHKFQFDGTGDEIHWNAVPNLNLIMEELRVTLEDSRTQSDSEATKILEFKLDLENREEKKTTVKEEDGTPSGRDTVYEGDDKFVEGRVDDDIGLEPTEARVNRPPPEPPDLNSLAVVLGEAASREEDRAHDSIFGEGDRRTSSGQKLLR
ncbi:hypothetical protein PIB30_080257 [Stylosanthes scabra]|uniref:Uncharacterized protein n=1 Tax=Stylosanthes scabra TaxID=79078 RepID=A0ABU6WPK9_9FABA|nr:hypothetical protein [Stylosanthes scabra]